VLQAGMYCPGQADPLSLDGSNPLYRVGGGHPLRVGVRSLHPHRSFPGGDPNRSDRALNLLLISARIFCCIAYGLVPAISHSAKIGDTMVSSATAFFRAFGELFHCDRIFAYCGLLLAFELALFLFIVAGTHGWIVPLDQPTSTDFASFYAAGSLADAGTPELAYNQVDHYAAEERATAVGIVYKYFYYPPVFLLLCAAFARLPYMAAFLLFEAATLFIYLLVGRAIIGERGWAAVVPFLAFPAVFWTIGLGQNAFLTAALFGTATLLVDSRPVIAGLLFGAVCYKPHFGLLIPVALAAGGRWRAFGAAGASVAALFLCSLLLFGWKTWHDFLAAAAASHATYESGRILFAGFISPWGAVLQLGGAAPLAYAVQTAATLSAAVLVGLVWRRNLPLPVRAAALTSATLIAIPVVLIYDLMLAAIAVSWLVRAGRETGMAAAEKVALAAVLFSLGVGLFLLVFNAQNLVQGWQLPIAPLAVLGLFAIVAKRALCPQAAATPQYALG
jgi:glycosyl transferase family 87